jgi:glycosyltransferase involved in cell wall biosynthesis
MRVLHVTDTFLPKVGGAEIAIDQLVRAMTAQGVDCAVLAQRPRSLKHEIETPYPLRRFRNPQSSTWSCWWIARHIARVERELGPFDVLIGHHAFPPGYACVKHARRTGRPAIIYPRGGDIYEVSRFRKKPGAWRRLSWALANSASVICASEAMEGLVRQIIGLSAAEGRLTRIPNGVNLDDLRADASSSRFATDAPPTDPSPACPLQWGMSLTTKPFILALGRTIRRKGFHLLIEAFAQLNDPDWKLVIAGEGRELDTLKQQAHPLRDRVLFTGLVEGPDKRYLLQHCQFMAAPSLEESFGNVALEAMACAKPVIASNASGFAEIIKDNQNGRLVEVGSTPALLEALRDYTTRPLTAESYAAHQTAQSFSWPTIAQRYIDLIHQVLATV